MKFIPFVPQITKTTNDRSKELYFIRTTLHVADYSIHHQVYTDLKFMGQCNSYHIISISKDWDLTLQNKCYNNFVMCI